MSLKRWADEVVRPTAPVALPRLAFLNGAPLDDGKELAIELATRFNEARVVKAGADAWATVGKGQDFETWRRIGAALSVGRSFALKASGASAPIGRPYSATFSSWLDQHGFQGMSKPLRSWTLDMHEHLAEISQWRATLTDRERRRLTNPQSIVRRWRKDTAPKDKADRVDALQAAAAALGRFLACMEVLGPDEAAPLWQHVCEKAAAARQTGTVN